MSKRVSITYEGIDDVVQLGATPDFKLHRRGLLGRLAVLPSLSVVNYRALRRFNASRWQSLLFGIGIFVVLM
mgnify:CR=1 FL=1